MDVSVYITGLTLPRIDRVLFFIINVGGKAVVRINCLLMKASAGRGQRTIFSLL